MKVPIRTCRFCGKKGRWLIYVIWDRDNAKVGTGKRKWYQCPECEKKAEQDEVVLISLHTD